jgi:hypothetical protein
VFVSFLPQNEKGTMVEEVTEKTGVRLLVFFVLVVCFCEKYNNLKRC